MADELRTNFKSGFTVYNVLRNSAGKVLDGTVDPYHSTNSWIDWNVANVNDYDLATAPKGGDLYIGSMPSGTLLITDAGIYDVESFVQLGGSPADGDDSIGLGQIGWDGTEEISVDIIDQEGKRSKAAATMVLGTVVADGGNSTTQFKVDLTEVTNDHYNGRIVIFLDGALAKQATDITDYDGTNKIIIVTAMTDIPAEGNTFIIV